MAETNKTPPVMEPTKTKIETPVTKPVVVPDVVTFKVEAPKLTEMVTFKLVKNVNYGGARLSAGSTLDITPDEAKSFEKLKLGNTLKVGG